MNVNKNLSKILSDILETPYCKASFKLNDGTFYLGHVTGYFKYTIPNFDTIISLITDEGKEVKIHFSDVKDLESLTYKDLKS